MIIVRKSLDTDELTAVKCLGKGRKEMAMALFSYGTLQQPEVQLANYGRLLTGSPDALTGYFLAPIAINDPNVVAVSGKAVHAIACESGDSADRIEGMVFEISGEELAATDAYEVDGYERIEVELESGRTAWAYVRGLSRP